MIKLSIGSALLVVVACHDGRSAPPEDTPPIVEHEGADPEGEVAPSGYPGTLIPTGELGPAFMARQKLSGKFGDQEFRFEAVLQLHGGVLTVIGLTPMGTKAFVLTQSDVHVDFEKLVDRDIPFPPEYMLQDIHRTWFWHQRLPWTDSPPNTDPARAEIDGERVTEQWTGDGLVRRTFERIDGRPPGLLRIDYIGGHRSGKPARHVVVDNAWFGYRLEIETAQWERL